MSGQFYHVPMANFCVPLTAVRAVDLATAGGKGANLGELIAAGFDVPDGFVVTTDAYRHAVGPGPHEQASLGSLDVPPDVAEAIAQAYAALGSPAVAVRSSATAEDLPGAAFAGQHPAAAAASSAGQGGPVRRSAARTAHRDRGRQP